MKELVILDVIGNNNAILREFGLMIFKEIKSSIDNGDKVQLSFEGLKCVNSAFCHASIGNIFETFGENAYSLIEITGISKDVWKEKIKEAIYFALNPEQKEIHENLILELF